MRKAYEVCHLRSLLPRLLNRVLANCLKGVLWGIILKLGEVSEWLMVPLSKFAIRYPNESFYVQSRTLVFISQIPF